MANEIDLGELGKLAPRQMVDDGEYPGLEDSIARHPSSRDKQTHDLGMTAIAHQSPMANAFGELLQNPNSVPFPGSTKER